MIETTSPRFSPSLTRPMPTARARSPYSRQLVARQMPRSFSRKAVRLSRAFTWCQNSLGIVSQPSISIRSPRAVVARLSIALSLPPGLALLPAPLAARALFFDAEIEFLDVFLLQQPRAGVGHHDAADLQHVAVVRGLQRHVGVLLDQKDGDAALAVDPHHDLEDVLY